MSELKSYAADFFYPPKIPWVEKYTPKPVVFKPNPIKQPRSNMGFKRGQRKVNLIRSRGEKR